MTAHIRERDLQTKNGRVVVEIRRSTYRGKQKSLKAARLEKSWLKLCASKKKDTA